MIYNAKKEDLAEISQVHIMCFPTSPSTTWGGVLIEKYYSEYLTAAPELFKVCKSDGKTIGFCMGYYLENSNIQRNFIKKNYIRIAFKALMRLMCMDKAIIERILPHKGSDPLISVNTAVGRYLTNEQVDLLSTCVLPEYRGSGSADELIHCFEHQASEKGRKAIILSVKSDNIRAIKFYEKHGYQVKSKNSEKLVLIKALS